MSRTSRLVVAATAAFAAAISVYSITMGSGGSEGLASSDVLLAGVIAVVAVLVLIAIGAMEFGIGSSQ